MDYCEGMAEKRCYSSALVDSGKRFRVPVSEEMGVSMGVPGSKHGLLQDL